LSGSSGTFFLAVAILAALYFATAYFGLSLASPA